MKSLKKASALIAALLISTLLLGVCTGFAADNGQSAEATGLSYNDYQVGQTVTFGSFEQDNNTDNGAEAIEWIVLEKSDGLVRLISKYALTARPFTKSYFDVTWDCCGLRMWLNDEFYNGAFTSTEKALIYHTGIPAIHDNPDYKVNLGAYTEDYVFILSYVEMNKLFSSNEARVCYPTEYAIAQGVYQNAQTGACFYWTRTPGHSNTMASTVTASGRPDTGGGSVDDVRGGVRPCIWIKPAA